MVAKDIASTILVFTPDSDSGLEAVLAGLCPESQVRAQAFRLEDWLQQCRQPDLAGILVDTDRMSLGDLRTVGAGLDSERRPWTLLLVGDRGVAGFENLLKHPRTAILPKPWTPAGLDQALQQLQGASGNKGNFPDAFLGGMVEGLRDPLTSISGYLQLLENQDDDRISSLVSPALEAATQIASQLEFLQLASTELQPHVAPTDLKNLVEELADYCMEQDMHVEIEAPSGLLVDADGRYLRAAMRTGLLLLQRFGTGGGLRLTASQESQGILLQWSMEDSPGNGGRPMPPPPYLEDLFRRLAGRVPAAAKVECVDEVVPRALGLLWS